MVKPAEQSALRIGFSPESVGKVSVTVQTTVGQYHLAITPVNVDS